MSSGNFIDTLRRIGYPKSNILAPETFESVYELEATLPFLKWFCSCVGEDNFVTISEAEEYKYIQDAGKAISEAQLEESLNALGQDNVEPGAEILESDVNYLKDLLAKCKVEKNVLMARRNKLSIHHMALRDRISNMEKQYEHEAKAYRKKMDACSSLNEKISGALQGLTDSVKKMSEFYCVLPAGAKKVQTGDGGPFLTQFDMMPFHVAEEKFSCSLTNFTKKQFFEGMANMAGKQELERYDLVDVSLAEKESLRGDSSFLDDCREFSRLQQIFPKSECNHINALIGAAKALSALNEAKSICSVLKSNQFPTSATEISRLHHIVEQNIEVTKIEASSLQSSLPELIKELGALQGTEILTGDYDLKLQRQDYFVQKQDNIIDQLTTQRARNEFLVMLYELESRCHRETHHLLSAARQVLESNLQAWQQRMKELEDPDLSVKRLERNVVDTRDKSSARLYHLLGDFVDDDKMLYLPKQKVVEAAQNLHSQYSCARASDKTMDDKYMTKVSQLESCLVNSMSVLYGGSSTSSGQPSLSAPEIQSVMTELISNITKLETDLAEIVTDVNDKKMKLKNNLLLNKERELFTLFHTNPSRLQSTVNGLADRLTAQNMK